jgi:hypothetical protein
MYLSQPVPCAGLTQSQVSLSQLLLVARERNLLKRRLYCAAVERQQACAMLYASLSAMYGPIRLCLR